MATTSIEWADKSLNFYTWDCTKVSQGCKNCYMMAMAERFNKPLTGKPQWRGKKAEKELSNYKSRDVIFVNSMSDTYHESVPVSWIQSIHNAAWAHDDKIFLVLTKRPERALALHDMLEWPDNLWLGTSVESEDYLHRIDTLLQVPASGHFLSAEPLLEGLSSLPRYLVPNADNKALGWVIVGAESGGRRRPFNKAWASDIRDMCESASVPFMFKQGSHFKSGQDRQLDGCLYDGHPDWSEYTHLAPPAPVQQSMF